MYIFRLDLFCMNNWQRCRYHENLDHFLEKGVDEVFSAAKVTTLNEVVGLLAPSTGGSVHLEGPQEVRGVLEVGSNSDDFMDEILDADDAELSELLLDDVVGSDGCPLAVQLDKSTLVNQLADRLQVGGTPCDEGLANPQHVDGGLVKLDEHTVVDLPKPEQLKGLLDLGSDLVDTTNPHDESELVLRRHVVTTLLLSFTDKTNILTFHLAVLLGVLLGPLEDIGTLLLASSGVGKSSLLTFGTGGCLTLATLQNGLGDRWELLVWHSEKSSRLLEPKIEGK